MEVNSRLEKTQDVQWDPCFRFLLDSGTEWRKGKRGGGGLVERVSLVPCFGGGGGHLALAVCVCVC